MATVPNKDGNDEFPVDQHQETPTNELLKQIVENTTPVE